MKNRSRQFVASSNSGVKRRRPYAIGIIKVSCAMMSGSLILILCSLFLAAVTFAEEITARAAIAIEGKSERILFAKNPHLKLPPASTTKLVTAMVVLDKLHPDTILVVSRNAANTPSVSPAIRAGERFTVREMLYLALMRSVNSAAVALAEAVAGSEDAFARMMNEKVLQIGAENTRFINASGLPGAHQYITAFDLAKVMKESLKYPLIKEIINTRTKDIYSLDGRRLFVKNTNQLLWTDEDFIGGKTGYTRAARHCFVSAANKGQDTLITVVLGEPVRDELWQDSKVLLAKGYDVLAQKAEPMIYFSNVKENPVMLASYNPDSDTKISKVKYKKVKSAKIKKKYKVKTAKKKKSANIRIATKSKKSSGKNIS
ncbi:MAG: D-alanyl-D-alanine carboxypeptidase family protein [Nitrospirota bacterium]